MVEEVVELELETEAAPAAAVPGVVIGVLIGLDGEGAPLVIYPGNPRDEAVAARATARLGQRDVGAEVALLFEAGDPARPLVLGRVHKAGGPVRARLGELQVRLEEERLEISAEREVVIRCGKASITLTPSGKVLIRGTYLSSRSSGVNRIRGGSVQIN